MADDQNMHLVIIRHGESEWNKLNLFTGWTDVDLTDTGRAEAAAGGKALKEQGFDFDVCYTSLLKRAIHTLNIVLDQMDRAWLPVHKTWRLNERHYGALQGLNKAKAAEEHGEEQVLIWRRSFDVQPPALTPGDERDPHVQAMFRDVPQEDLPYTECLKDTIARAWPYFEQEIKPQLESGKRVLIAAHGNSLRALVMQRFTMSTLERTDAPRRSSRSTSPRVFLVPTPLTRTGTSSTSTTSAIPPPSRPRSTPFAVVSRARLRSRGCLPLQPSVSPGGSSSPGGMCRGIALPGNGIVYRATGLFYRATGLFYRATGSRGWRRRATVPHHAVTGTNSTFSRL